MEDKGTTKPVAMPQTTLALHLLVPAAASGFNFQQLERWRLRNNKPRNRSIGDFKAVKKNMLVDLDHFSSPRYDELIQLTLL